MQVPAHRLLEIMRHELAGALATQGAEISSGQAMAVSFALLIGRERHGAAGLHRQFATLAALVDGLRALAPLPAAMRAGLDALAAHVVGLGGEADIQRLEDAWRDALARLERIVEPSDLPDTDPAVIERMIGLIAEWEVADRTGELDQAELAAAADAAVTGPRLEQYLRERFDDPALAVRSFVPLPGGFGKQTFLFEVDGDALHGSFVMRRDFPVPLVDNDCHRIENEYAVIRAVRDRGFPAPDALWLDSSPAALPGGSFIVMRRSPGTAGGTVIGARGKVPDSLAGTLARILAEIHALPAMPELFGLTESINESRWSMSLADCVHAFLDSWPDLMRRTSHMPSPASQGMMWWLLDNQPIFEGRPVLLHGDIGFHNFLFDEGRLTAVLDWEFAHVGDPAEELAAVRNNLGDALDWPAFLRLYRDAGGVEVSPERIHFFQIWGHVRNALTSLMAGSTFLDGAQDDLKFVLTPHIYVPHFLGSARALIARGVAG